MDGALAQLVERLHGMQEVSGSTPLGSTNFLSLIWYLFEPVRWYPSTVRALCHQFACSLVSSLCHSVWVTNVKKDPKQMGWMAPAPSAWQA